MSDIHSVLPGLVLTASDGLAYNDALHRWCENSEKPAKYVVQPKTAEDVSKAVCCLMPSACWDTKLIPLLIVDQVCKPE
jgi:hypothetical protein